MTEALHREAFRAYYCAALAGFDAALPMETKHEKACKLAERAMGEEAARFVSEERLVEGLRKEVAELEEKLATASSMFDRNRHEVLKALGEADMGKGWCSTIPLVREQRAKLVELEQLAADRGEEVRGRGDDLRGYDLAVQVIAAELRQRAEQADEQGKVGKTIAYVEAAVMLEELGSREPPVDHARETLAQLEMMLLLPVGSGGPESMAWAERWGRVAGRIAALLERLRTVEPVSTTEPAPPPAEHINGIVAECGAAHGYSPHVCSRPAGHAGNHEAGLPWLSSWPQVADEQLEAMRPREEG